MIDNFDKIRNFLTFGGDEFYYLKIIKRRKDNPTMDVGDKSIKYYFIDNIEYFDNKISEIIELCKYHNARAYINLNRRNYNSIAHDMIEYINRSIKMEQSKNCKLAFEKTVARSKSIKGKNWIIDVDVKDINYVNKIIQQLHIDNVIMVLPTKNGYHIISKPFDNRVFKEKFSDVEIKKNSPTILFNP